MPRARVRTAVGKRVFLRKPAGRDRAEYLALRRDSARFLRRWEPQPTPRRTAARQFADRVASSGGRRHEELLTRPLEDRTSPGSNNLNEIVRAHPQRAYQVT